MDDELEAWLVDVARTMSAQRGIHFDDSVDYVMFVVTGQPFERGLKHTEIGEGSVKSIALRHIPKSAAKLKALDLVMAFATFAAFFSAEKPLQQCLNGVLAILFVARGLRDAMVVELGDGDAAIVLALRRLDSAPVSDEALYTAWKELMTENGDAAPNLAPARFKALLKKLSNLGVIKNDSGWRFEDEVREAPKTPDP